MCTFVYSQKETIKWYLDVGHEYWDDVEPALVAHPNASMGKLLRWHRDLQSSE